MQRQEGDEFESMKELPNGEWIEVKMRVDEIEELEDGTLLIHSSMTEQSQQEVREELQEMDYGSF